MEIFTDASVKYLNQRYFSCAGAECPTYRAQKYEIVADATNNKGEIMAIYLGVQLAYEIIQSNPGAKEEPIIIYSDSQISVFGLREWMPNWLRNRVDGTLMTSTMKPVKNQEVFLNIIAFLMKHDLKIILRHQKGHIGCFDEKLLSEARSVYYDSNGELIDSRTLSRICYYNNIVDKKSREALRYLNPNDYPPTNANHNTRLMAYYVPPEDYKKHIS